MNEILVSNLQLNAYASVYTMNDEHFGNLRAKLLLLIRVSVAFLVSCTVCVVGRISMLSPNPNQAGRRLGIIG